MLFLESSFNIMDYLDSLDSWYLDALSYCLLFGLLLISFTPSLKVLFVSEVCVYENGFTFFCVKVENVRASKVFIFSLPFSW